MYISYFNINKKITMRMSRAINQLKKLAQKTKRHHNHHYQQDYFYQDDNRHPQQHNHPHQSRTFDQPQNNDHHQEQQQNQQQRDKDELFQLLNNISMQSQKSGIFTKRPKQGYILNIPLPLMNTFIRQQMSNNYIQEKKKQDIRLRVEQQKKEKQRQIEAKEKQKAMKIQEEQTCSVCKRQFTLENFPLSIGCPHYFCPLCLYSMAQSNIDIQYQLYVIKCPFRDMKKSFLITQTLSDDIMKNLQIPKKEKFISQKMKSLVQNVRDKNIKLAKKNASGIFIEYRCKVCSSKKTMFLGLKEYDLVQMALEFCTNCKNTIMLVRKIIFQDCEYDINGLGTQQQFDHQEGNAIGQVKEIKIQDEGWEYLEFSANKPNVD